MKPVPIKDGTMKSTHIVLLGSNWANLSPYLAEEMGVALINHSEPATSVREMAVHSANGEMAMPTIICILGVIANKYAEICYIHPALKEVPNHITRAIKDLREAVACFDKFHKATSTKKP